MIELMLGINKQFSPKVVLVTMLVGTFVASVSQSMLTAALPAIMRDFSVDATLGQLLTTCYIYMLGIVAAFSAYLVTRCNIRRLFLAALALFAAGCALAYAATSYPMLLAARIMQACGTGVLMPLIQVVALEIYPKDQYGQALGLVGLVFGFAPVMGPTLSGVITDALGWRTIFLLLGGVAVVSLVVASFMVRDVGKHRDVKLDVPSVMLFTFGLIVFMLGVTELEQFGPLDVRAFVPTLVAVALIIMFVVRQLRCSRPYLKLALFGNKVYAVGVILLVIAQMGMMSAALQVPLYLQEIHGFSATQSGLTLLPGALCLPLLNPLTGRLFDRFGGKFVGLLGFSLLAVGTGAFMFFSATTPHGLVTAMYLTRMVGVAFVLMPMTAYCMSDLPASDIPQGTAIVNSLRQVFGSLGSSIMVAIVTHVTAGEASVATAAAGTSMHGFSVSFGLQALLFGLSLVGTIVFVHGKRKTRAAALMHQKASDGGPSTHS